MRKTARSQKPYGSLLSQSKLSLFFIIVAIGILAIGGVIQLKLRRYAETPINIAMTAREHVYAQQIAEAALSILNPKDSKTKKERIEEIRVAITEWHPIHENLMVRSKDSLQKGESNNLPATVAALYQDRLSPLFQMISADVAQLLNSYEAADLPQKWESLIKKIETQNSLYLFYLDHLDLKIADKGKNQIIALQNLEGVLILISGFLLLLVTFWLYIPATHIIKQQMKSLRELASELREKNKLLSDYFLRAERRALTHEEQMRIASHDIRNPVSTITGFAGLLRDQIQEGKTPSELLDSLGRIERNASQILAIIDDIMLSTKIETDKADLTLSTISVVPFIKDVIESFRLEAHDKDLKLSANFDNAIQETIQTDHTKLERILSNLIGNAIKYTEKGSVEISVKPSTSPEQLDISVKDSGPGINPEDQEKIFEPFARVSSGKEQGLGLGLTITKRLTESLGGSISISSRLNEGSVFTVSISKHLDTKNDLDKKSPTLAKDNLARALKADARLSGCKILVVDDTTDARNLLSRFLCEINMQITEAKDGEAVFENKFNLIDFDYIILDMNLPKMSGIKVAKKLRSQGITIPIIAITNYSDKFSRQECLSAGCTDFVSKPISPIDLAELLIRNFKAEQPTLDLNFINRNKYSDFTPTKI